MYQWLIRQNPRSKPFKRLVQLEQFILIDNFQNQSWNKYLEGHNLNDILVRKNAIAALFILARTNIRLIAELK